MPIIACLVLWLILIDLGYVLLEPDRLGTVWAARRGWCFSHAVLVYVLATAVAYDGVARIGYPDKAMWVSILVLALGSLGPWLIDRTWGRVPVAISDEIARPRAIAFAMSIGFFLLYATLQPLFAV